MCKRDFCITYYGAKIAVSMKTSEVKEEEVEAEVEEEAEQEVTSVKAEPSEEEFSHTTLGNLANRLGILNAIRRKNVVSL